MSFCIDCHEERAPELTDCATCHRELRADTKPRFRAGARLVHDIDTAWQRPHGPEYQMDPQFCPTVHTEQEKFFLWGEASWGGTQ